MISLLGLIFSVLEMRKVNQYMTHIYVAGYFAQIRNSLPPPTFVTTSTPSILDKRKSTVFDSRLFQTTEPLPLVPHRCHKNDMVLIVHDDLNLTQQP